MQRARDVDTHLSSPSIPLALDDPRTSQTRNVLMNRENVEPAVLSLPSQVHLPTEACQQLCDEHFKMPRGDVIQRFRMRTDVLNQAGIDIRYYFYKTGRNR